MGDFMVGWAEARQAKLERLRQEQDARIAADEPCPVLEARDANARLLPDHYRAPQEKWRDDVARRHAARAPAPEEKEQVPVINARSREYASLRSPTDVVARLYNPARREASPRSPSPAERKAPRTPRSARGEVPQGVDAMYKKGLAKQRERNADQGKDPSCAFAPKLAARSRVLARRPRPTQRGSVAGSSETIDPIKSRMQRVEQEAAVRRFLERNKRHTALTEARIAVQRDLKDQTALVGCTFHPVINAKSVELLESAQTTEPLLPLYERGVLRREVKQARVEEAARRRAAQEVVGCTFQPALDTAGKEKFRPPDRRPAPAQAPLSAAGLFDSPEDPRRRLEEALASSPSSAGGPAADAPQDLLEGEVAALLEEWRATRRS